MMEEEMFDIKTVCRICLKEEPVLFPMFEENCFTEGTPSIPEIINQIIQVKVEINDQFPQQICFACMTFAIKAYEFRQKAFQSYQILVEQLGFESYNPMMNKVDVGVQTKFILFFCNYCNTCFSSGLELEKHNIRKHPQASDETTSLKVTPFSIEITPASSVKQNVIASQTAPCEENVIASQTALCEENVIASQTAPYEENVIASQSALYEENMNASVTDQSHIYVVTDPLDVNAINLLTQTDVLNDNNSLLTPIDPPNLIWFDKQQQDSNETTEESESSRSSNNLNEQENYDFADKNADLNLAEMEGTNMFVKEEFQFISDTEEKEEFIYESEEVEEDVIMINDGSIEIDYECEICKCKSLTKEELRKHMFVHMEPHEVEEYMSKYNLEKIFKCDGCDMNFATEEILNHHKKEICDKNRIYNCSICEQKFSKKAYWHKHLKAHKEMSMMCKFCTEVFQTSSELQAHEMSHPNVMHCDICGKNMTRKYYKDHLRRHLGEKNFKCNYCDKSFMTRNDIRKHLNYHTGKNIYKCHECDKTFYHQWNFKSHMANHLNKRQFKCDFCPQRFNESRALSKHQRKHSRECFKCKICDEYFMQLYLLRQHNSKKHGINENYSIRSLVIDNRTSPTRPERVIMPEHLKIRSKSKRKEPTTSDFLLEDTDSEEATNTNETTQYDSSTGDCTNKSADEELTLIDSDSQEDESTSFIYDDGTTESNSTSKSVREEDSLRNTDAEEEKSS